MVGTAPRWAHHEGQPSYYRMTRDEACPSMFYTCADVYVGAELPGHDQKWRVETHTSHGWLRVICKINLTVIYIKSMRPTGHSWILYHLRAYISLKNNAMFDKLKRTGFRLWGLFPVRNAPPPKKKTKQKTSRRHPDALEVFDRWKKQS